MKLNKEIGIRVKAYRKKLKYSQEHISDMIGVSRVNYVNMESGRQNWKTIYLYNLCRIFDCRPTNLFPNIEPLEVKMKTISKRIVVIRNKKKFSKIK